MSDIEDLYGQAWKAWTDCYLGPDSKPFNAVCAVVDLVLAARDEPTADGEALAQLVRDVRDGRSRSVTIDGVLIAPCDTYGHVEARHAQETQPWEVLREAADIMHPKSHPRGLWTPEERSLRDEAKRLEAEHRAAREKAERAAEQEKLIEQAHAEVDRIAGERGARDEELVVACLVAAGWRPAPDCGHPNHGASDHDCGPFIPESDGGAA